MSLKEKLGKEFVVTTELGPVKGALYEDSLLKAKQYKSLEGINIHDCPMGNLRINSISMAALIQRELKVDTVPHFTCRDRSLLGTQADLLGAHALGIRHLLVSTGDPPRHGPYETSKGVYNYNTFDLIKLIKKMNQGLDYNDKEFGGKTDFTVACTAEPTAKNTDAEMTRMGKKILAGADFFQTQVVYNTGKALEFAEKARKLGKPVIMGIMPLKSVKMARYMKEKVEGIEVPDEIISAMENEGKSGIDICCGIIKEIYSHVDGVHIMALGDVEGTNSIIDYIGTLG